MEHLRSKTHEASMNAKIFDRVERQIWLAPALMLSALWEFLITCISQMILTFKFLYYLSQPERSRAHAINRPITRLIITRTIGAGLNNNVFIRFFFKAEIKVFTRKTFPLVKNENICAATFKRIPDRTGYRGHGMTLLNDLLCFRSSKIKAEK